MQAVSMVPMAAVVAWLEEHASDGEEGSGDEREIEPSVNTSLGSDPSCSTDVILTDVYLQFLADVTATATAMPEAGKEVPTPSSIPPDMMIAISALLTQGCSRSYDYGAPREGRPALPASLRCRNAL